MMWLRGFLGKSVDQALAREEGIEQLVALGVGRDSAARMLDVSVSSLAVVGYSAKYEQVAKNLVKYVTEHGVEGLRDPT